MRKILLLIPILFMHLQAQIIDKSRFDLERPAMAKTSSTHSMGPEYAISLENDRISATLINGAYFTLGTTKGISESRLDDNCDLTFGHPFAKTSYPVFSIDGNWYRLADYFTETGQSELLKNGDTLKYSAQVKDLLHIEFSIIQEGESNDLILRHRITNLDSVGHSFGQGIVVDPALGKWGDGHLFFNEQFVSDDIVLTGLNRSLVLWERAQGAKGIALELQYTTAPDQVIVANWPDVYLNDAPDFEESPYGKLYDLVLQLFWNEQEHQAGEQVQTDLILNLAGPDFSSPVFMRWDLPQVIGMENGLMFPRNPDSYIEINNQNEMDITAGELHLTLPRAFKTDDNPVDVNAPMSESHLKKINLQSKIVYEDEVSELNVKLIQNNVILDEMNKRVFVPATIFSEEGLLIVNDSLATSAYPNVEIIFSVEKEETGQRILNLTEENIFLFEDDQPIDDFSLEKYGDAGLVDVVFVLDCSGSMQNEIDAVRDNIGEFADSLAAYGYDYKIGIVTFSTSVDDVWDLTDDIDLIRDNLASISLWGGIEDSPAALWKATELSIREGSKRTIIWITDEAYPETTYTKEQIVNRMLEMDFTVHGVGLNNLQTDWFSPIVIPTGGNFYDINGNFRDILLDVSRMEAQDRYMLSYTSPNQNMQEHSIKLQLHYAGLGVVKFINYSLNDENHLTKTLNFYPNPFNPTINFQVNAENFQRGEIKIYNLLGQLVKNISFTGQSSRVVQWNAANDAGNLVGSGFYVVQLFLYDSGERQHHETAKILYLK